MKHILLAIAFFSAVTFVGRAVPRTVDQEMNAFITKHEIPGAVVAYGKAGERPHVRAFGNLTADARLPIASLTKPITSEAVMELVRDGKMALDAPLMPGQAATVRQALQHRAGFPDSPGGCVPEPTTQAPAGTYSNAGYCVIGDAIERASGEPYADFVREHVIGGQMSDGPAQAYGASGGWETTAADLFAFASRKPAAESLQTHPLVDGTPYGMGWVIWPDGFGHVGALPRPVDVQTVIFHGNDGRVFVVLLNHQTADFAGDTKALLAGLKRATSR